MQVGQEDAEVGRSVIRDVPAERLMSTSGPGWPIVFLPAVLVVPTRGVRPGLL